MAVRYKSAALVFFFSALPLLALPPSDAAIDLLQPGAPVVADRNVLILPDEGTLLAPGSVEQAAAGWVVMRRKSGAGAYELLAGRPSFELVEKAKAFDLGEMSPEEALNTRFYRKIKQPKFQDEAVIYVDNKRIYCTGLHRLYYTDGTSWKELTGQYVGAYNLRTPEGTRLLSGTENPGWISLMVEQAGMLPRLTGLLIQEKKEIRQVVKLSAQPSLNLSALRKNGYLWSAEEDDALLQLRIDSLKAEMKEIQISLAQQAVAYDSAFGEPDEFPVGAKAELKSAYNDYVAQFQALQKRHFLAWAEPILSRSEFLKERRQRLEFLTDSLAEELKSVEVIPSAWRLRPQEGRAGMWDFRLKVDALEGELEGIWKGMIQMTKEQSDALQRDLLAKDEQKPAVRLVISYRNKRAVVQKEGVSLRRFYRIESVVVERAGEEITFVGSLELPDYVRNAPEVIDYLNRTRLSLEQTRIDELARQQGEIHSVQRDRLERQQKAMTLLRGPVVEISGGIFNYKGDEVEISPFAIGATEVTQELWERFYGKSSPAQFKDPKKPVTNIDWSAARGFCLEIGGDLPTEAQWEYAARAGSADYFYWGPKEGPAGVNHAVFYDNSKRLGKKSRHYGPWKVASLRPNGWGLFDVAGNVAEWIKDYHTSFSFTKSKKDPQGPQSGFLNHFRVVKGGSWKNRKKELEHAKADWEDPRYRGDAIGIRCAFPSNQQWTIEEIEAKLRIYVGDTVEVLPPELKALVAGADSVVGAVPPVEAAPVAGADSVVGAVPPVEAVPVAGADSVVGAVPPVEAAPVAGADSVVGAVASEKVAPIAPTGTPVEAATPVEVLPAAAVEAPVEAAAPVKATPATETVKPILPAAAKHSAASSSPEILPTVVQ